MLKEKLMEAMKSKPKMSEGHMEAKKNMLKELIKAMDGEIASPMKKMKQVTVAAPTEEGLKAGLEKAEEVVEGEESEEKSEMKMVEGDEEDHLKSMIESLPEEKLAEIKAMIEQKLMG